MRGFLLLLAAVLVAIGVGVGAVAAAGPSAYGLPGATFTAAWPGALSVRVVGPRTGARAFQVEELYTSAGHRETLRVWDSVVAIDQHFTGWTGYAPLTLVGPPFSPSPPRLFTHLRPVLRHGILRASGVRCAAGPRPRCVGTVLTSPLPDPVRFANLAAVASAPSPRAVRALLAAVRLSGG